MECLKWISGYFYNEHGTTNSTTNSTSNSNSLTNYYYLSLIFNEDKNAWSIHGLWPQYSLKSYPSYCKKVSFDINLLDTIMNELQNEWYSTEGPDADFWKHEWEKHGSCMFTPMNELQYFTKALELFDSIKNNNSLIDKFKKNKTQSMIPYDQDFNIIIELTNNNENNE